MTFVYALGLELTQFSQIMGFWAYPSLIAAFWHNLKGLQSSAVAFAPCLNTILLVNGGVSNYCRPFYLLSCLHELNQTMEILTPKKKDSISGV